MAWTSPRTWTTSELVTASIMNTHVRDNFSYLKGSAGVVDIDNAASAKDYLRITNSSGQQKLVMGNQDGSGANNPAIIMVANGAMSFGGGDSWTTSGGTFTATMLLTDAGMLLVGDSANADMTVGLTLNQGAANNHILALKSSDVAHGVTGVAETDTYGYIKKTGAADGGLWIGGLSEASGSAIVLEGISTGGDTTKSTAATAPLYVYSRKKSGTAGAALGANENAMVISNNGTVRFILDGDGDSHQDVGTAWTNFDDHTDADLLTALSVHVSRPGDPIKDNFRRFLRGHRRRLETLELVQFNRDGHHFVNMSRLTMLLVGAVRQTNDRVERLLAALAAGGMPAALLKGV